MLLVFPPLDSSFTWKSNRLGVQVVTLLRHLLLLGSSGLGLSNGRGGLGALTWKDDLLFGGRGSRGAIVLEHLQGRTGNRWGG
jgi:hypothetical protein